MSSFILAGAGDSNKIYQIGRIGYDSGAVASFPQDPGETTYYGEFETERMSPAGEDGLVRFRRIVLRALTQGSWEIYMEVFVDDVQTKIWDNDETSSTYGQQINQSITITSKEGAPGGEAIMEADIDATGTFVQVFVRIASEDIQGYFLPESLEAHVQAIRESKSRSTLDVSVAPWAESS